LDIVVLNCSLHKKNKVIRAIKRKNCHLFGDLFRDPVGVHNFGTVLLTLLEKNPVLPLGGLCRISGASGLTSNATVLLKSAGLARKKRNVHKFAGVDLEDRLGGTNDYIDLGFGVVNVDMGLDSAVFAGVKALELGRIFNKKGVVNLGFSFC